MMRSHRARLLDPNGGGAIPASGVLDTGIR